MIPTGSDPSPENPLQLVQDDETTLLGDPRFEAAVIHFNDSDWYPCHDEFEMLWHETQGPLRPVLQALLQIAVAHIHLERGNLKGATVLLGEGLGRLAPCGEVALGIDLAVLRKTVAARLKALQLGEPCDLLPPPRLLAQAPPQPPVD